MITLKQLCEATGVSRRTVQGYEKQKLVIPAAKDKMGYLLYEEATMEKVREIRLFQDAGMTLREIKMMEQMDKNEKRRILQNRLSDMEERDQKLKERMAELERYITKL